MDMNRILEYTKRCFTEKYADFSGRARRAEFWSYSICVGVISGILNLLASQSDVRLFNILAYIFSLAVLVPGLAVAWRRLHDTGRSGTWYLLNLIPLVGWIILIVWYCQEGQPGDNQYGADPKLFD